MELSKGRQNMQRVLLLNHRGLGDVLMSLPACRWLAYELGNNLWMTVKDSLTEDLIKNERCGENFVNFNINYKHPYGVLKPIWKFRKIRFDTILAPWGYDCQMVKRFSHLIGAKNWICHTASETEALRRDSLHKRFRHIKIVEQLFGEKIPDEMVGDFYFDFVDLSTANQLRKIGKYIVMVPGSGEIERYKRWPLDKFIKFGIRLLKIHPEWQLIITGANREFNLGEKIVHGVGSSKVNNFCGKLTLSKLKGVFKRSQFVLGGDSGGLHIAKAAGARVSVIMGPGNYALTGPIDADVVIDLKLPGTPWYSRSNYRKRAYSSYEPSMQVSAGLVMDMLKKKNLIE